jgi:hypothetical protein
MTMLFDVARTCVNSVVLDTSAPAKVTFVDEQPPNRQNLAYYADYSKKDAAIAATDAAYVQVYHSEFPNALASDLTWETKESGSRSHCKADSIEKVASLNDIVVSMIDFLSSLSRDRKKLGTILLFGHGTPQEFALPIVTGGSRLALPMLEIGLRNADSLRNDTPSEWKWGSDSWSELRKDLQRLEVNTMRLSKYLDGRTDENTLIRMWCCNLGQPPRSGDPDPLAILGRRLLGGHPGSIEAPQHRSFSLHSWFSVPKSTTDQVLLGKIFDKGQWHPDTVAEVESDNQLNRFTGKPLRVAKAEFITLALRPPPTPDGLRQHWIAQVALEDAKKKVVHPKDWQRFSALWRKVQFKT